MRANIVADRLQEVGLAEPGRAVEKERIVGLAGLFGDGERGGVGEVIGGADDELLEGVLGVGRGGRAPRGVLGGGAGWLGRRSELDVSLRAEDCGGASVEHCSEALGDPVAIGGRGREDEDVPAELVGNERVDPARVGRLVEGAPELGGDLGPDV
jgi:hypothetical protein